MSHIMNGREWRFIIWRFIYPKSFLQTDSIPKIKDDTAKFVERPSLKMLTFLKKNNRPLV